MRLNRVELELSVMVIEEPTVWSFDLLRGSDRTNCRIRRQRRRSEVGTRQMANQIARFEDIKRRQAAVLAVRSSQVRNGRPSGAAVAAEIRRRKRHGRSWRPTAALTGWAGWRKYPRQSPVPRACADERGG